MHLTRRLLTTAATVTAVLATALSTAPQTAAASAPCTSAWRAVQKVAVRMPAWNEGPVATTRSPIVRYLRRGERVRSCVVAVGRDASQYRECGGGSLWRVVPGGQVPSGCLRRA
ncbi:hypothetical protein WN71_007935 [Streptomyces mangrovisoli]|uniref:Secreted protein n=2 Tax=Streptomyces mangrovisoli TaxID=1428628 RepID=A0A1J4P4G7_9ACTN|nr:hypothetical protein WN71_007935 [Streptomyces mangrovisoli]